MSSTNSTNPTSKRTVVEEGTHFKGNLTSTCPIDVRGRVEGDVQAPSLTVSARGAVHGHAKVGAVHSEGELSGEFEAETVELSGTVKDKTVIRARSLEVRLSSVKGQQVLFGDCELSVGDEPSEYDAVEESAAPVVADIEAEALFANEEAPAANEALVTDEAPIPAPAESDAAVEASVVEEADAEALADSSTMGDFDSETRAMLDVGPDDISELSADDKPVANSIHEALASEIEAPGNKGKGKGKGGKRKDNGGEPTSGWSQPPSQPPPAE